MNNAMMDDAYQAADTIIGRIKESEGVDYTPARDDIAELFNETLWNGNWDATTDLVDLPNLRFIQEDEFDQHMDDDGPDHDSQICFAAGHYVFYA